MYDAGMITACVRSKKSGYEIAQKTDLCGVILWHAFCTLVLLFLSAVYRLYFLAVEHDIRDFQKRATNANSGISHFCLYPVQSEETGGRDGR